MAEKQESEEIEVLRADLRQALKKFSEFEISKDYQDGYRVAMNQAIKLVKKAQRGQSKEGR